MSASARARVEVARDVRSGGRGRRARWALPLPLPLALALALALGLAGAGVRAGELTPGREAAVRSVFRDVLKLRPPGERDPAPAPAPAVAPRHMLELYRRYAAGGAPRRAAGSTVRSITPATADGQERWPGELLVFNVSAVSAGEEVTQAQLHLHRRRQAPRHHHHRGRALAPPARVRLLQLAARPGGRASALASLPVPGATRGGWTALDVTAVLRELLLLAGRAPPLLAVRFEAPRGRAVAPQLFLKGAPAAPAAPARPGAGPDAAPAFLVVFSEDSPDNGISEDESEWRTAPPLPPPPHTHDIAGMLHSAGAARLVGAPEGDSLSPSPPPPAPAPSPAPPADADVDANEVALGAGEEDFYLEPAADPESNNLVEVDDVPARKYSEARRRLALPHEDEDEDALLRSNSLDALPDVELGGPAAAAAPSRPRVRPAHRRPRTRPHPHARARRSVLDNELPGVDAPPAPPPPKTSPETVLAARRPAAAPTPDPAAAAATIPRPHGGSGGGRRLRGPGRRRGRGRGRRRGQGGGGAAGDHKKRAHHRLDSAEHREREYLPDLNRSDFGLSVNASADGGRGGAPLCQRKMLQVDFSAIGWEKFIVAPQSFEAHYCAGDCPFPIAEELRPTNHATLQSLVRQLGEPVPAPCCVPDHLSSLSLLYLDSSGDVVLKNYPNMAVESCACR